MNVATLKSLLEDLPDDMEVIAGVSVPVPEEKRAKNWPSPFNLFYRDVEFNDIGWSENVLSLGITLRPDDLP